MESVYPLALEDDEPIMWHSYAERENSSQALCVSAFGSLRADVFKDERHALAAELIGRAFPSMRTQSRPRKWKIGIEVEEPELLNEHGPKRVQPTSIDVLFTSSEEVVALEAKFDRDAGDGFGTCSQNKAACQGHFGPGSDAKRQTAAWCRLEDWDGARSPRVYWSFGRRYFQPSVFNRQAEGETCPLGGPAYQLMRNFLFAAAYAERHGKKQFGVLVICSARKDQLLREQIDQFKNSVLLPEYRDHLAMLHYENWIEILAASALPVARDLAGFLKARIEAVLPDV